MKQYMAQYMAQCMHGTVHGTVHDTVHDTGHGTVHGTSPHLTRRWATGWSTPTGTGSLGSPVVIVRVVRVASCSKDTGMRVARCIAREQVLKSAARWRSLRKIPHHKVQTRCHGAVQTHNPRDILPMEQPCRASSASASCVIPMLTVCANKTAPHQNHEIGR
jgi:hypothetical protein